MDRMKAVLIFLLLAVLPLASSGAFDLQTELGKKTFRKSGLEKLSEEELATLNAAVAELMGIQEEVIRAEVVKEEAEVDEVALPQGEDSFGLETVEERVKKLFQKGAPDIIESRIMGEFSGWSGNTRFILENGQVWRQSKPDTFVVGKRENPEVVIRRGKFGGYLLKIKGYNSRCRVERVK